MAEHTYKLPAAVATVALTFTAVGFSAPVLEGGPHTALPQFTAAAETAQAAYDTSVHVGQDYEAADLSPAAWGTSRSGITRADPASLLAPGGAAATFTVLASPFRA